MKKRTREESAAYKREYRARKSVPPSVPPSVNVPPCPTKDVPPVPPDDRDMVIKILRAKLLAVERQVELLKRDIPKKSDSPYKFGPERSLNG